MTFVKGVTVAHNKSMRNAFWLFLGVICLSSSTGCIGLLANFLNVVGAGLMPPAFAGLEEKKVAVVCVSNSELFGPTSTSTELAVRINRLLAAKVKDIEIVSNQRTDDWIDQNGWDMIDFVSIGRGVEADIVVAVDVDSFSVRDGSTMYKGRADVHVVVYDMQTGQQIFAKSPPQIEFPTTAGVPAVSTSERDFRKLFLDTVASRIARNFYAFDINEDVARDVATLSRI